MDELEIELWNATLSRATSAGVKASRTKHEVVLMVLDVFGDMLPS